MDGTVIDGLLERSRLASREQSANAPISMLVIELRYKDSVTMEVSPEKTVADMDVIELSSRCSSASEDNPENVWLARVAM